MTLLEFFEACMSNIKEVVINGEKAKYTSWENSGAHEEYLLKIGDKEVNLAKTKIYIFDIYEYSNFVSGFGIAIKTKGDIIFKEDK